MLIESFMSIILSFNFSTKDLRKPIWPKAPRVRTGSSDFNSINFQQGDPYGARVYVQGNWAASARDCNSRIGPDTRGKLVFCACLQRGPFPALCFVGAPCFSQSNNKINPSGKLSSTPSMSWPANVRSFFGGISFLIAQFVEQCNPTFTWGDEPLWNESILPGLGPRRASSSF
jgi:hypothetical protein